MDYLNSIISTIWFLSTENVFNQYHNNDRYDYIVIDTKEVILFDFNIDKNIKNDLIEKGYKDTFNYLTKILPAKKKILLKNYIEISEEINLFKIALKDENITKSINILNEILSKMPEKIEYIDKYYYSQIKELKEILLQNIKTVFIFHKKISNFKQIINKTEFIKTLINERISELTEYISKFCNNC